MKIRGDISLEKSCKCDVKILKYMLKQELRDMSIKNVRRAWKDYSSDYFANWLIITEDEFYLFLKWLEGEEDNE